MLLMHVSKDCMLATYIMLLRLELERSQSKLDKVTLCCSRFYPSYKPLCWAFLSAGGC